MSSSKGVPTLWPRVQPDRAALRITSNEHGHTQRDPS